MPLAIQLLGPPQFQLDEKPVTAGRRAVVALLAYLAVTELEHPGQRSSRESLAELLWTGYDPGKALTNLRHTLWEVTQFIGDGWIVAEHETIYLNPGADVILDLGQFRSLLGQAARQSASTLRIPLLAGAVSLYRGDFLKGFLLKDGSEFNEWVLAQTEVLRRDFASALERLVSDYRAIDEPLPAIPYAQRLVALEPLHDSAHRTLMQLFVMTDQHTAALQQYKALEKLLRKELNLDPQPETRELYKKIRKGNIKPFSIEKASLPTEKTRPKHNLTHHLTTFVGREKELDEIGRLLVQHRLLTLAGAGGIGKTRLAIETGWKSLDLYPDGVWFVSLESISDEKLVPRTVASELKIPEATEDTNMGSLVDMLRSQVLLLILDNCEHLLDACAKLAEAVLKNCSKIRILTTSREVLRLEGEAFYHVPALGTPDRRAGHHAIDEVIQYEAIRLFLERAGLVVSGFELTKTNVEAIISVCNRLNGIPLAVELAAAQLDIFTPHEILKQLNGSFDLLVRNTRLALSRHQTMRTCIDWGWNLLSEPERLFMSHLSVFVGGWTLQAAQTFGFSNSRELTTALVKKSFVIVHQPTSLDSRYGFHEVIRSYAQEKLRELGKEEYIRDLHLDYFLDFVKQLKPGLHGDTQEHWLERLFVERDNLRTALEWAARTNVSAGLFISSRLRSIWENYDQRNEVRWLLTI